MPVAAETLALERPRSLKQALALLAADPAPMPIAGCTDVYVGLPQSLAAFRVGQATLRIELPLLIIVAGLSFPAAYTLVAWISWVPNWLAVEWWLRKGRAVAR